MVTKGKGHQRNKIVAEKEEESLEDEYTTNILVNKNTFIKEIIRIFGGNPLKNCIRKFLRSSRFNNGKKLRILWNKLPETEFQRRNSKSLEVGKQNPPLENLRCFFFRLYL